MKHLIWIIPIALAIYVSKLYRDNASAYLTLVQTREAGGQAVPLGPQTNAEVQPPAVKETEAGESIYKLRSEAGILRQEKRALEASAKSSELRKKRDLEDRASLERSALRQANENMNRELASRQAARCIANLRQIEGAKDQWGLEEKKGADAVPVAGDLAIYFPKIGFPVCPGGGTYQINALGELPVCSVPGHRLGQ